MNALKVDDLIFIKNSDEVCRFVSQVTDISERLIFGRHQTFLMLATGEFAGVCKY